jgi:hypothetical protein
MVFEPQPVRVQRWQNQPLTLFHGTLAAHITSIEHGVELRRVRRYSDFGRGFYTTTSQRQARFWAEEQVRRVGIGEPAIARFVVPRAELAKLRSIWFVRGGADGEDYWRFVEYCRTGRRARGVRLFGGWYDLVVGPVAINWRRRRVLDNSDQVSFHTGDAIAVLMQGYAGSLTWQP